MPRFIGPWRERRWWRLNMPFFTPGNFSPATLFAASEPGLWLDPSDFSTMFQDSAGTTPVTAVGQSVGRILDKSGRGNHASQATAASRPVLQIDGTGKYYLAFDGVDDFLLTPTVTPGTNKAQVFIGIRKLSDATVGTVVESGPGAPAANNFTFHAPRTAGVANYGFVFRSDAVIININSASSHPAPDTAVVVGTVDLSGDLATTRVNGVEEARSTADFGAGSLAANAIYIGRRGGTTGPFNGRIYSLIVRFGANLTAGQISDTERAVNSKTGAY